MIEKFHHVAFRCNDAKETVEFYKQALDMDLVGCMAEDRVPSTHEPDPYMHVFLNDNTIFTTFQGCWFCSSLKELHNVGW